MKRLLAIVAIFFTLNSFALEKIENKELQGIPLLEQNGIKVKKVFDAGSLYIAQVVFPNGAIDTAYITKDKKYLLSGDVINTQNGSKLSIPVDMSILKGKEGMTYGTGKREFVLFTDTQCPYCKKFESFFPQLKDKIKINVFFFPLSHHEQAFDISMYIMSQKTQLEKEKAFLNTTAQTPAFVNRNIPKAEQEKLAQKINEQMYLGQEVGVQGTPMLFDMEGNKVNWMLLLQEYGIKVR
jgi:thiol:disulfide interchange protein DsbC